ncbi:hypothetical protein DEI92_12165 [Curtobacterium sp. MCBD17_034]|nr:hypothetical protein [Curtobacterium sp. MCBD17_034]PZF58012.1 hypothetical protein DEI92_12165 [Curtobacterium sp. MCBD17_034]PZM33203.1 hypothetical protein DEI90_13930 [Curtobacterium sp. MCBD17_031]
MLLLSTWLLGAAVGLWLMYVVIRAAVLNALSSHYKTVRWFEATGEWDYNKSGSLAPQPIPASEHKPVE